MKLGRKYSILTYFLLCIFFLTFKFSYSKVITDDDVQIQFDQLLKGELKDNKFNLSSTFDISSITASIPSHHIYSNLNPKHRGAVIQMVDELSRHSTKDFIQSAATLRSYPQVNEKAWLQAVLITKLTGQSLGDLKIKMSLPELIPDLMFGSNELKIARNQSQYTTNGTCIVTDERMTEDNGLENILWYFRQDVFANSHHHFWHIYYYCCDKGKPRPDRKGELFYFMHHEFLARYAAERLSNKLPLLSPLRLIKGTPLVGYNSHLTESSSNFTFTPRRHNTPFSDVVSENLTLKSIENIRHILLHAIRNGFLIHENGSKIQIQHKNGIELLTDVMEASVYSINTILYGFTGLHNSAHYLLAYTGENKKVPGVALPESTSFRDPAFYQLHLTLENLFQALIHRQIPYGPTTSEFPLVWNAVKIIDVGVRKIQDSPSINELSTHWSIKEFSLKHGLDWVRNSPQLPVRICSKHLDHDAFHYNITLKNFKRGIVDTTIRIFLAPRFDSFGKRYTMTKQHKLFFTLDRFSIKLNAGLNVILRSSLDSTLTIPARSWLENQDSETEHSHCGCGWPNHLLLPKGTLEGGIYDLFVMATNAEKDKTEEPSKPTTCQNGPIWCGVYGEKYPDAKPMGYPFDRTPFSRSYGKVKDIEDYTNGIQNMKTVQIRIFHNDEYTS